MDKLWRMVTRGRVARVLGASERYLRHLRPEYLGEYLPIVKERELEARERIRSRRRLRESGETHGTEATDQTTETEAPAREQIEKMYSDVHPFLPLPHLRDRLREQIERREMMKRRQIIDIPRFCVGSIMAVTIADKYATGGTSGTGPDTQKSIKQNRFVGLCIFKRDKGLISSFRLRNVIDNIGIEVEYELYNPTVISIEVLKLERRLDPNLFYLRDAPQEFSTFPLDMAPVPQDLTAEIPLNDLRVPMNPRPWSVDWHHHNYRGMLDSAWKEELDNKRLQWVRDSRSNIDRYDLMKIYRERGTPLDRQVSMKHVEILHRDLIEFQRQRHEQQLAELKRARENQN